MRERLEQIFGHENVSFDELDLIAYGRDASSVSGIAKAIVLPTDISQIQKLVLYANRADLTLTIRGAGTGLAGGSVPQSDVIVDLSKLNTIKTISFRDNYVYAEAGVVLADINAVLEKHGYEVSVKPSSYESVTIGGMIATNAAGNRAVKYGKTRDNVLEIEVIDGSGKYLLVKEGGDFVGTEGILGIIISAKLKIRNIPVVRTMNVKTFDFASGVIDAVNETENESSVCAVEFFDKITAKVLGREPKYNLLIEYEDDSGDHKDVSKLWALRDSCYPQLALNNYQKMEDPRIPRKHLGKFLNWLLEYNIPCFGHIALGIIHPCFMSTQEGLIPKLYELVVQYDGLVSGEHGIGISKKQYLKPETIKKLTELKKKYDPHGILNKGKIL